jgi:transcriptional regulator with XRE-family HTH domain
MSGEPKRRGRPADEPTNDSPLRLELARRLRTAREAAGLTQQQLADKLPPARGGKGTVFASRVAEYERAVRLPSVESLCAMAAVLGVRPGALLDDLPGVQALEKL